jgi:hypothetical protein
MELQEFIGNMLIQLEDLPHRYREKHSYLIDEVIFEMNVAEINQLNGRVNVLVGHLGTDSTLNNSQKVTIKLKPKNRSPKRIMEF